MSKDDGYRADLVGYKSKLVDAVSRREELNAEIRKLQANINALNHLLRLPMESFKKGRVTLP